MAKVYQFIPGGRRAGDDEDDIEGLTFTIHLDYRVRAFHFVIGELETGALEGHAVICPDARYASVRWRGADRLDRRFADRQLWLLLVAECHGQTWGPKGLAHASSGVQEICTRADRRHALTVQFSAEPPLTTNDPSQIAAALDTYLHGQAFL